MIRRGEYKLHWQMNDIASFAEVTVSVEEDSEQSRRIRVAASLARSDDHWIEAATRACERCLELLRRHALANDTTTIVLENLTGMVSDTTENAVEAASVLAVAEAFELRDQFSLQRREDRWHVEWRSKQETVV